MPPLPASAHHDGTFLNCGVGHFYFALTVGLTIMFDYGNTRRGGAATQIAKRNGTKWNGSMVELRQNRS